MYSCKYHVVWCPKYRRKVLTGAISDRLKELIIQKSAEIKVDIIEMEIMPDPLVDSMTPEVILNFAGFNEKVEYTLKNND